MKTDNIRKRRVIILGIDGATFDLIRPWAQKDLLPNFKRVLAGGSHGELMSTIPPLSAQAWTSFATGKNPGKHGIFDFTNYNQRRNEIEVVNRKRIKGHSLWNVLSRYNKKVIVANVPLTYPPEKVNGILVTGWLAPSTKSDFTYPKEIKQEILKRIGDFRLEPNVKYYQDNKRHNRLFARDLRECLKNRRQVFDLLFQKEGWDFFTFIYVEPDRAQYKFWKYSDSTHPAFDPQGAKEFGAAILETYQAIDETLGKILASMADEDLLLIMSDHGFGPLYKTVYLNKWLEEKGFLRTKETHAGLAKAFNSLIRRLIKISRWGILSDITSLLNFYFPWLKNTLLSGALFSHLDWQKTRVFSVGYGGNIYINLKGRQPQGVVPEDEYEALRNSVIAAAKELIDPDTKEPMVERVWKREELFRGECISQAPDLVFQWKDYKYWVNLDLGVKAQKSVCSSTEDEIYKRAGDHKLFGVFCAYGKNVEKGRMVQGAKIVDIFPTVLYYMGLPIPEDIDGRVIKEMFVAGFAPGEVNAAKEKMPFDEFDQGGVEVSSRKEQELLKKRLQSLGYM